MPDVVRTDVLQYGCEHVLDPGVSRQGMFWCAEAAAWTVYGRRSKMPRGYPPFLRACLEQPASAAGVISRVEARGDRRQGAYLGQDHMGQDRPRGQRYLSPTAPGDGAAPLHSAVRCRSAGNRTSLNTAGCAILRMTKAVGKCPRTWKNCCGFRIPTRK